VRGSVKKATTEPERKNKGKIKENYRKTTHFSFIFPLFFLYMSLLSHLCHTSVTPPLLLLLLLLQPKRYGQRYDLTVSFGLEERRRRRGGLDHLHIYGAYFVNFCKF